MPASPNCMYVKYSVQFSISEQLLDRNVPRSRVGLVFKARILCVSLSSRLESHNERERENSGGRDRTCLAEVWSGSGEGSYLRLVDFLYHSALGWRVMKIYLYKCMYIYIYIEREREREREKERERERERPTWDTTPSSILPAK